MAAALLALVLATAPPVYGSEWTASNTVAEAAFGVVMLADYLQTRQIVARGLEANPIMGPRGDRVSPGLYFPLMLVLHVVWARLLPEPWRSTFQALSICFEAGVVGRNASLGFSF